jgi:L-aminopeptidase/D-esterase-like protein
LYRSRRGLRPIQHPFNWRYTVAATRTSEDIFWLFPAVAESVEEAVINSLCAAGTVAGRDGHTARAMPIDQVAQLVARDHS